MSKWIKVQLGQVGFFSTSSVDKKSEPNQQPVRLVNYMDVYRQHTIDASSELMEVTANSVEIVRSQVLPGDILFTPSSETPDDIGHSAVVAEDLPNTLHSYHTVRMRPHSKDLLDIRFSAWFCNSNNVRKQFEQKCAGSTRYTLSIPAFRSTFVEIPESLVEQKEIASYLDVTDQAIERTVALIDKYQQIKAGLMHDLFTRGIGADGQLRPPREQAPELYQDTEIGWIPKDWYVPELASICKHEITYGIVQAGPPLDEGIPYIRTGDMAGDHLIRTDLLKTSPNIAACYKRSEVRSGEIVCAIRATVGKVLVVPEELDGANLTQGTARIAPSTEMYSRFVLWGLRSEAVQRLIGVSTKGTTFNEITLEDLRRLRFPVPANINEQQLIADRMDACEHRISAEKRRLEKLLKQKAGLMHDLLTGRVPVKVEPEAEPEAAHV